MNTTLTNKILTPMSRTKEQMNVFRKSMKNMGFNHVILNRSHGRERNGQISGKINVDYVEFFIIPDLRPQSKISLEDGEPFRTVGFSYSYIDKEADEQTVTISVMDKVQKFNEELGKIDNKVTTSSSRKNIDINQFLSILKQVVKDIKNNEKQSPDEFFTYFCNLSQVS